MSSARVLAVALSLAALLSLAMVSGASTADENVRLEDPAAQAEDLALDTVGQAVEDAEAATADEPSTLDEIGAAFGAAAEAIAEAAAAVAGAVADVTLAIGHGLITAAQAVGSALAWTGQMVWRATVAVADGLAWLATQVGHGMLAGAQGLWTGIAWTVTALADAVVWTGSALWTGVVAGGQLLVTGAIALGGLVADLGGLLAKAWPEDPRMQAAAASGAAATTAAAAGAAWYTRAWRYLAFVPGLAPLYTRLARGELLEHPMRQAIHGLIQENPGIHVSEIGRELDASWGTLLHHLDKLERAKLIVSEETGGKRCFFLPGQVTAEQKDILPALENETARALAEYFGEHPGSTQKEAAQALDLSAALVSWHIKRLEKAGVITRERVGRTKRVGLTGAAMTALASA